MEQGYRSRRSTLRQERRISGPSRAILHPMKSLITIAALAIIGAIVYKILSAEVPIDES
jgi:hypothetical protein